MRYKDKEKIINKVLNADIENELEKEIYLEYLDEQMNELIQKNKADKRMMLKQIFSNWKEFYKDFHSGGGSGTKHTFVGMYYALAILFWQFGSAQIFLGLVSVPVIISMIKSINKFYLSNKKNKLEFNINKKNLENEIIAVKEITFEKEETKQQKEDISNSVDKNEKYILDAKEKTKIYDKITCLLIKIKGISDDSLRAQFALELTNIVNDFNNERINLENLNQDNQYLILKDKFNVELSISLRLDDLERELNNVLNKENRMEEDSVKVK